MSVIKRIKDVRQIIKDNSEHGVYLLAAKRIDEYYREKCLQIVVEDQKEEPDE